MASNTKTPVTTGFWVLSSLVPSIKQSPPHQVPPQPGAVTLPQSTKAGENAIPQGSGLFLGNWSWELSLCHADSPGSLGTQVLHFSLKNFELGESKSIPRHLGG